MGKLQKYTEKQRADALEAVHNGMTLKEAAELAGPGVPWTTVAYWSLAEKKALKKVVKPPVPSFCPYCGEPTKSGRGKSAHLRWCSKRPLSPARQPVQDLKAANVNLQGIEPMVAAAVEAYMKANPYKMSLEEFMLMMRGLGSELFKVQEELARLRKSNQEWQKRAGRALEQAQEVITGH